MRAFTQSVYAAALLCSTLALVPARAGTRQDSIPSYISAQHRMVLEKWLKQKPNLRVATIDDLDPDRKKLGQDMFPDRLASPFYVVGDFNHDGRKDFAVGLVIRNKPEDLPLAVFNAPFGRTSAPAFYNENRFDRSDMLFISTDERSRDILQVGTGTDTRTVLLKPKGRGYYVWVGATQ